MAHAYRHLTGLRVEHDSDYIEFVDLTHLELFDWCHWLACRPGVEAVVGNGAWAFWSVRTGSRYTNLLEHRGDFLERRINRLAGCALAPAEGESALDREA